jgi:hypothetical protein
MRTTIGMAAFLAVGASAMGVGAVNLLGSDTLKKITQTILTNPACNPGNTLVYLGTGSGAGEAAIVGGAPTQQIAPMSRFLKGALVPSPSGVCATGTTSPSTAEGVVFALDGLSIVGNKGQVNNAACNGTLPGDCSLATDPGVGLGYSRTVAGYTFNDWSDVLRVIFAGMDHTAGNTAANRNCASTIRQELASHWGELFENPGCTSATCITLQHAFRRNDESGTTDVIISLLNLPSLDLKNSKTPFCNAISAADTLSGALPPSPIVADPAIIGQQNPPAPPTRICPVPAGLPADVRCVGTLTFGPNWPDFQDRDVIRRNCVGVAAGQKEDVCSARGDLGLVLPIWDAPADAATSFPKPQCSTGKFIFVAGNRISTRAAPGGFDECPAGVPAAGGSCAQPAACLNATGGVVSCTSPLLATVTPLCTNSSANRFAPDVQAFNYDGRVYNLHLHANDAANGYPYIQSVRSNGSADIAVPMVGAYYRLHQNHSIASPAVLCDSQTSATNNIGCLVQASPCSIGYAGREAAQVVVTNGAGAQAMKVNQVDPVDTCIQNLINLPPNDPQTYRISRRLYLNTVKGFEAVTDPELSMASCFAQRPITDPIVASLNFVPLSPLAPGNCTGGACDRPTYCQDFNETVCGAATNNNACCNNTGVFPTFLETGPSVCP